MSMTVFDCRMSPVFRLPLEQAPGAEEAIERLDLEDDCMVDFDEIVCGWAEHNAELEKWLHDWWRADEVISDGQIVEIKGRRYVEIAMGIVQIPPWRPDIAKALRLKAPN